MLNTLLQDTCPAIYNWQPKLPKNSYKKAFRGTGYVVARVRSSQNMDLNLAYMEQYREQQASRFAQQAEAWLQHLRHELRTACTVSLEQVSHLAEKQLYRRDPAQTDTIIAVTSQQRILNLYRHFQKELTEYFGDQAQDRYVMLDLASGLPTNKTLQSIGKEHQTTLFITEIMTKIINKAYRKVLDQCMVPFVSVAEKVDVGTLSLNMVGCSPAEQKRRCLQEMQKRLQGIIKSYFIQLEQAMVRQFATLAYQLYDELVETRITWQTTQILSQSSPTGFEQVLPAV